jgi:hypothetical protein
LKETRPKSSQEPRRIALDAVLYFARMKVMRRAVGASAVFGLIVLVARGLVVIDVRAGRRRRTLGPIERDIAAPPEVVFDVIAAPYLGRTPRAMQEKLQVLQRGTDMVLAAHRTPTRLGVATTIETVRFERPRRVDFQLVRGPVPEVTESFELRAVETGTHFTYTGELSTDFWLVGRWWGALVARVWERTVAASIESIAGEAERLAAVGHRRP